VLIDLALTAHQQRSSPRKILLWNKADKSIIGSHIQDATEMILRTQYTSPNMVLSTYWSWAFLASLCTVVFSCLYLAQSFVLFVCLALENAFCRLRSKSIIGSHIQDATEKIMRTQYTSVNDIWNDFKNAMLVIITGSHRLF
jgi:hypothetical protein